MKSTVYKSDFIYAFNAANRADQFSHEAREILFDYLEQCEEETGEQIELDVIGICCEYSEDHWADIADSYLIDLSDSRDDGEKKEAVQDFLEDHTIFIGETSAEAFIYQVF